MILHINTSSNKEISVGLSIGIETFTVSQTIDFQKAQVVLELVDTILKKNNVGIKDVTEIKVATGPGSFTGLRVGIAVANALGWVLGIAVNGKDKIVSPTYENRQ